MTKEMAAPAAAEEGSVWLRPWRVVLISLGAVVVGSLLLAYEGPVVTPVRLLLIIAGLIAGGWAIQRRLTTAGEEFDERVESAGLVAVYSFCGLVGFLGMAEPWFSGRIFFAFFITGSILGSLLVLMPRVWRRLTGTVLILLHFLGIVVASTCSPAMNGQSPWLPSVLFVEVYRPYLTGMYLTNAYHFYAPDPGSSTLVWIRIEYEDGSHEWHYFPDRPGTPTPIHYLRQLSICESANGRGQVLDVATFERQWAARNSAGRFRGPVPPRSDLMPQAQYSPPNEYSREILSSMARHVCKFYPHPKDPTLHATGVKIYRVAYSIIKPPELLKGADPMSDDLKLIFFMGDFDTEGHLIRYDADDNPLPADSDKPKEDDPLLYWAIPRQYLDVHANYKHGLKPEDKP